VVNATGRGCNSASPAAAGASRQPVPGLGSQAGEREAVIAPSARWQSTTIVAILVIPLLAVVLLSAPAWVALALPKRRPQGPRSSSSSTSSSSGSGS
jgi:hypothetical protein